MNSILYFIEFENRVITATYRNLMIGAKVVLVDMISGDQLTDPITTIASSAPNGLLRIRLPAALQAGTYYLRALNGHGQHVAQTVPFPIA